MQDLHDVLTGTGVAALNQTAALSGLGGIGKTQTAVEYAYRYFYDTRTYDWVFWVKADTELNLVTGMAAIAQSLDLGEGKLEELAARSRQWLETRDRWLLIFDNADEPQWVKSWLPRNPQGRVLLTSRAQRFTSLGIKTPIAVKALSLEESIAFLRDRTNRPVLAADELTAATALATELAGLPLALEQAAAYIAQMGVSFAVYWKYYQQQQLTLLEKRLPETGDYPQSVATTWLLNFEEVEKRSPASVPILRLSALLAADDIPELLLLRGATELGLASKPSWLKKLLKRSESQFDELKLAESLSALADFSLIQREQGTASYSIHRMVQAVIWDGLPPTERQDWLLRAIAGLNASFPDVVKFENWAVCEELVPHVQAIATRQEADALETTKWALLLNRTGYYLDKKGRYAEAKPLYVRSLAIREQQLGSYPLNAATGLNNLARLYYRAQGYDSLSVAASLNNLAGIYQAQGRYSEAEPLYMRSLNIREKQLGREHLDVAQSLNNLAQLYQALGNYDKEEIEHLLQRSLSIYRLKLGHDHPDVALSLNNLALFHQSQDRYSEAEVLHIRALDIRERKLGADHPDVANSLISLAGCYQVWGQYDKAEPLLRRSLVIVEQHLGADHPTVATNLNNLAGVYEFQKRYSEAELLYIRALDIQERKLGTDHPHVASSFHNLARIYQLQKRNNQAEPLYLKALDILENRLGKDHPNTKMEEEVFQNFLEEVIQRGQTAQLSKHPRTQSLLRKIRQQSRKGGPGKGKKGKK